MKNQNCRVLVACLLCLSLINLSSGQASSQKTSSPNPQAAVSSENADGVSFEEELIKSVYNKLTDYSRETLQSEAEGNNKLVSYDAGLKFALKGFRTGHIQEILSTPHKDLVTLPTGDIVQIGTGTISHNGGEEEAIYRAEWISGRYASIYDRNWTIGDILGFEPTQYYDVEQYTSYEVTVSFESKTRTYRALVLFHNRHQESAPLKPEFWDSIVGMGGILTDVWKEIRSSVKQKSSSPMKNATSTAQDINPLQKSPSQDGGAKVASIIESYLATSTDSTTNSTGPIVENTTQNDAEHTAGEHGQLVRFQGSCSAESNNQQGCRVSLVGTHTYERGEISNWF